MSKPWPWQVPGRPTGFYSILGAYELAYAAPAMLRATGEGRGGYIGYLIAARVRSETMGEGS